MDKTYQPDENTHHMIDGGSLIQRIPCEKGNTFGDICNKYYTYLSQTFTNATIVFGGYASGPSTKDMTHFRWSKGNIGTNVKFRYDTHFKTGEIYVPEQHTKKQHFICLLGDFLTVKSLSKPPRGPNNCMFWAMIEADGEVGRP